MTVETQNTYKQSLKDLGLVPTFKVHCPSYDNHNSDYHIPIKTVDNEINSLVKKIESTPVNDLNINKTHIKPIIDFGAAFPFKLLSQETVNMLLWEALEPDVIKNYSRLPNYSKNTTRLDFHIGGHLSNSQFTRSLAKSKELAEIVSTFIGHPMKPIWDCDMVHINVNISDATEISTTTGVHYESIFVPLVIMLDLPEDAEGGQTTIITGNEKITRVPDPPTGSGTLIQGRVLRHLASKPVTNHNRISFVISYATGVDGELDNCVLTSVKPSVLPKNEFNKFYRDWVDYKFNKLEKHLNKIRNDVVSDYESGKGFNQEEFVLKCKNIEKYLHNIYGEMECVGAVQYPSPHFNLPYNEL